MAWTSRIRLISALVFPLVAGCGGGSGAPMGLAEAQSHVVNAICKFEVACSQMPDFATCQASLQMQPGYLATLEADIASGKVHYDGIKARSCVEALERLYGGACTQSALAASDTMDDDACDQVIVGTAAAGAACFFAEQCASGLCQRTDPTCSQSRQCCIGACAAKPAPIPVGGDCSAPLPDQACEIGAVCLSSRCVAQLKVEGAACTATFQCASPLFCDPNTATNAGVCRHAAPTGGPCNASVFVPCDDLRDYCDPVSGTCKQRIGVGGTCDAAQTTCVGFAQCEATSCVPLLKAGQACSSTSGPDCLGSLQCATDTNTCALVPGDGVCS